jgi:hypothetical protein
MDVLNRAGSRIGPVAVTAIVVVVALMTIGVMSGLGAPAARGAPAAASRPHLAPPNAKPKPKAKAKAKCRLVPRRNGKKWVWVKICPERAKHPSASHAKTAAPAPEPGASLLASTSEVPTPTSTPTAPVQPTPPVQSTGPSQPAGTSAWDEPALVDPTVITLSASHPSLTLDQSQDYIVQCPSGQFDVPSKITIWGGHNVLFEDCDEYVTNPSGDWAGELEDQTGTLWIHDVHFGGAHLTGGVQMQEPGATVVMRDVLFDTVYGSYSTNHAECIQTWSGPARFMVDGLQCPTTYQGLFLLPNQWDSTTLETTWDFRKVQIDGDGAYDLWLGNVQPSEVGVLPVFNVQNVYDCGPGEPRDWDGTSDGDQAWAAVKSCSSGSVPAPVWSDANGSVTGLDDGGSPPAIAGEQP